MPGLPATGELSYNGYVFDGATHITVNTTFEYDDAQQVVTAQVYTIRVEAIIANANGLDNDMLAIRKKLGVAGRGLTFTGKGFGGDIVVGPAGGSSLETDVKGGPFPRILDWRPIGDNNAAEIVWIVDVALAKCEPGDARRAGIKAIVYDITYDIDSLGDTTRTFNGYIEIVRRPGRDTADGYRDFFQPPPLTGYKREQSWRLSADRSRVNFVITDTQIPTVNPYPLWVGDINGTHRFSWRRQKGGGLTRMNTISCRIAPTSEWSGSQAYLAFLAIVEFRRRLALSRGQKILFLSLDVEENLFGRPQAFSVSYKFQRPIRGLVRQTGLWTPLGTSWNRWQATMGVMLDSRGASGLRDIASDNVVVNLCTDQTSVHPNNRQEIGVRGVPRRTGEAQKKKRGALGNEMPSAGDSFLGYRMRIRTDRRRSTVRHQPIQPSIEDKGPWRIDQDFVLPPSEFKFEDGASSGQVIDDVFHESTTPAMFVELSGDAERAGHVIPRPRLESVGGKPVKEVKAKFVQEQTGSAPGGIRIFRAAWKILYYVQRIEGAIHIPNSIIHGLDDLVD
jgi:hypothetical protein